MDETGRLAGILLCHDSFILEHLGSDIVDALLQGVPRPEYTKACAKMGST